VERKREAEEREAQRKREAEDCQRKEERDAQRKLEERRRKLELALLAACVCQLSDTRAPAG